MQLVITILIFLTKNLNMKKIIGILFLLMIIVCGALALPDTNDYEYLRLHIRANSNSVVDQNIKYKIKDEM